MYMCIYYTNVYTVFLYSSWTLYVMQDLTVGKGHRVQLKEAEGFASTYYNIPTTIVQRVAVLHQGKVSDILHTVHVCTM